LSSGVSLQTEYQWTRSLDDADFVGGPQNPAFPNLDYGNTSYVRRQELVFNYIWDLPLGRGKRWLGSASRGVDAILGGWKVSGITTYAGGVPFSVNFSVPATYVGWWGGRADKIPGNPYAGQQKSHDVTTGVPWFNPAAFAPPQPWTWGNSARDTLFGPGLENWDISALKNFQLEERLRLQFRADLFDAFNHFNLGSPTTNTIADTRDGGPSIPSAGKIFTGTGNRIIQLGVKLFF
jgi:hypothetical protein